MATEVLVPSVGESITEGILASWEVEDKQYIEQGTDLFELETDKTTLQVPAPASGVIHIIKQAGTEVEIGSVVATIDANATAESVGTTPNTNATSATDTTSKVQTENSGQQMAYSSNGQSAHTPPADTKDAGNAVAPTSPSVRRMLNEGDISSEQVTGSGGGGRITNEDVQRHMSTTKKKAMSSQSTPHSSTRQHREPLTKIRKSIAANLMHSRHNAAHLTTFNEVDMTEVQLLRTQYREKFEAVHNIRLGFMSFFVLASCKALMRIPKVNAFLDGEDIVYNDFCNVGVAIAGDNGLIVPVLKDAQQKHFADIEMEIKQFAIDAKNKRLMPDALSGGTFTITNGGVFGSLLSTPIPNPPQTAILGMHTIQKRAMVIDDSIQIRPMMYVALTYDHRLIDGKEAVQFLATIKALIEQPAQLMLDI